MNSCGASNPDPMTGCVTTLLKIILQMTIPTQLDPYPDIAGCQYPYWGWIFSLSYFLIDDDIIKSRKSYIVDHFFFLPFKAGPAQY
jgi:hypothetical protein